MKRIYLVPGIDDTPKRMRPIQQKLKSIGYSEVYTISVAPNDGSIAIEEMAKQVMDQIHRMERQSKEPDEITAIGYSMGGMVLRYAIQRLDGKGVINRFISISAPHHGTIIGYLRGGEGVREMRPRSKLLQELRNDRDPWGNIPVYSFWTPLDLMVVPSISSVLQNAINRSFLVACHPCMTSNNRVIREIIRAIG